MGFLDIGSVRYVALDANYDVLKFREFYGGRDIVCDALFEQNRSVCRKAFVCGESCDKGGGIIASWGMRDDVSCPSRCSKGYGKQRRDEVDETHGRHRAPDASNQEESPDCWLVFFQASRIKYQRCLTGTTRLMIRLVKLPRGAERREEWFLGSY